MNCSNSQNDPAPGSVVWLTGLPASGKTTIARCLQAQLRERGLRPALLDSDRLRDILTPEATYEQSERDRFYKALAQLAAMLAEQGVPVIIAATANRRRYRQAARERVTKFCEVFVDCPLEVCRERDPKGLYKNSDEDQDNALPGVGVAYEAPEHPELTVHSHREPAEESAGRVADFLLQ